MVQVDEQGIDLKLAKKLSKEVLPHITHPHPIYKRQAMLNPKKMRKLMQLEDIINFEPQAQPALKIEEPSMALALLPVHEDQTIVSIDSV
jgi:hypothetical protein